MNKEELLTAVRDLSEADRRELLSELRLDGQSYKVVEMSERDGEEAETRIKFLDKKSPRPVETGEEENIDEMAASVGPLEPDFYSSEPKDMPAEDVPTGETRIYGPTISASQLADAIVRDFGPVCEGGDIYVSDGTYFLYSDKEIQKVLDETLSDLQMWISEYFDCDDFAQVVAGKMNEELKGSPFGTLWFRGSNFYHAVNCFYSKDQNKMKVVEPQTDAIYDFDKKNHCPQLLMI